MSRFYKQSVWIAVLVLSMVPALAQTPYGAIGSAEVEKEYLDKAKANIDSYRKGEGKITFVDADGKPLKDVKASIELVNHEFLFGCSIFDLAGHEDWSVHNEEIYKQRFKDVFNFAAFPTHWTTLEYTEGKPYYEKLRKTVEWCRANDMVTKGHALTWAHWAGEPYWLEKYDAETSLKLMQERVYRTAYDLKGEIDIWDVVNEATNMVPWKMIKEYLPEELGKRYQYRAPLEEMIEYVEIPFRNARKADPEAELLLNDFNQIAVKETRDRYISLVQEMKKRNIPIDGLGVQAHEPTTEWYAPEKVWTALEEMAVTELPVHITEIMISSSGKDITGEWRTGTWTPQAQSDAIIELLTLCFGHQSVTSFNFWVNNDENAWYHGLGLLDENLNPKPVFHALRRMIKQEWHTKTTEVSDKAGEVSFNGFYGKYKVIAAMPDGTRKQYTINHNSFKENNWTFIVK